MNAGPEKENAAANEAEKRKAEAEAKRKREAARRAAEEKRRYFEFYDDVKHDRNKEW